MRALTSALCGALVFLAVLVAAPAWAGGRENSPYRLAVDPGNFRLHQPLQAPGSARPRGSSRVGDLIERHARARGLDPALVRAVVQAESAFQPEAVSPKGAVGLMQVMPETGRRFGALDLKSPEENIRAGTAYLDYLLDMFNDVALALAAYNAGEGAVMRYGNRIPPYPETRAYVQGILKRYSPGRSSPLPGPTYLDGTKLEARDASLYRLRQDPWRALSGRP